MSPTRAGPVPSWLPPVCLAIVLYGPAAARAGWLLDDARALATHANHGAPWGEWTHPTYAWSAGDGGHLWRPIPAFLQHLLAMAFGRSPEVFRFANLGLHLGVIALAAVAARAWGASPPASLIVGLVVAAHPSVPEVVGWSSDIFDIALALVLVGTLAALRSAASRPPLLAGGVALIGALVACLCKESALLVAPALAAAAVAARPAGGAVAGLAAGVGATIAAGLWYTAHAAVTGEPYAGTSGTPLVHVALAGLDAVGSVPTLPPRATAMHLFDPAALAAAPAGVVTAIAAVAVAWGLRGDRPRLSTWVAACVGAAVLLAPAAVGVPFIGVQASRYVYVPMIWLATLGAAPLEHLAQGAPRRLVALFVVAVFVAWAPRSASRIWEYADDATHFAAELRVEPTNPYARARLARVAWSRADTAAQRRVAADAWALAIEDLPPSLRVPDANVERWDAAQAAFLSGSPAVALRLARAVRRDAAPPQLDCLIADSLDALGRHEEATTAGAACGPLSGSPRDP